MKKIMQWLFNPPVTGPSAILILRLMTGGMFFWEGVLKFVYLGQTADKFTLLDFPFRTAIVHVIATLEIAGGLLLIAGFLTRVTALYFILQVVVTLFCTRFTVKYVAGSSSLLPDARWFNVLNILHAIRPDYAQVLTCLYMVTEGPGRRSIEFIIYTSKKIYSISRQ
ncbi:MAG: DoxX family protein [Bacteroidota bacterium]